MLFLGGRLALLFKPEIPERPGVGVPGVPSASGDSMNEASRESLPRSSIMDIKFRL